MKEDELVKKIERAFPKVGKGTLGLGVGDDAALFTPSRGFEVVLTCDWFLEGTHFLRDKHPPDSVGWKCLARAVSDIAAMGGVPRCFLLSLALPTNATGKWLDGFLRGLRRAARELGCELAGGDTTQRDEIQINVTVVGEVRKGRAIRRTGAKDGDYIYMSGRLGEAELGLHMLRTSGMKNARGNRSLRKHLYPQPRLELGQWLAAGRLATSMMDISDGLSTDLARLCAANRVGALLDADGFPFVKVPEELRGKFNDPVELALNGGDDYELLFTAPRGKLPSLPRRFRGLLISPIGGITSGPNVVWSDGKTGEYKILQHGGWDPFRAEASKKKRK